MILDGKIAARTEEITDEEWLTVNKYNREMVQDYLDNQSDLSAKLVQPINQDYVYFLSM